MAAALLPAVAWVAAPLGSARYGLARPLALVAVTAVVWWPAVVVGLPFARWSVVAALVACGAVGWALWWRRGLRGLDLRAIGAFELVWLAAFALYLWFRGFTPDIINTEKPMEIALLSSITRSTDVPAPDPWLAGEPINYYYFGYQMVASVIKLTGVPAATGFNLALATLFAMLATVAAALGYRLAQQARVPRQNQIGAAMLAPIFLLLSGNLETAKRLARNWSATVNAGWWDGVGWNASRVIYDTGVHGNPDPRQTINEFPAFSFVLGDLHPHVLTYPLLACVVALAVGLASGTSQTSRTRLVAVGALVGLLYASNSWDAPIGLLVVAVALALHARGDWRSAGTNIAWTIGGAALAAAPFILTFDPPIGVNTGDVPGWLARVPVIGTLLESFGVVTWQPTSAGELLTVHGLWITVFGVFAAQALRRERRALREVLAHRDLLLLLVTITAGAAVVRMPAIVLVGWPFAIAAWLALSSTRPAVRTIAALYAVGFLLVLIPEFIYIQDVFADRMNTVFKLYFQAWLLFALASAGAIATLFDRRTALRWAGGLVAVAALAVSLPYVWLSASDWTSDFADRQGLDGSAYLERANPADAAVIDWIDDNADSDDTIAEAPGCQYINIDGVPMDRVSAFTGIPTVVGWLGHESQWRRGQEPPIDDRLRALELRAEAFLNGSILAGADGAQVDFVILGEMETEESSACDKTETRPNAAASLESAGWQLVFDAGGARVYAAPEKVAELAENRGD
jgi:YYY domain-containing protein